ncbi:MAG: tetratricopeptide repeat protein, partial [Pirellulales bacterium]
MRRIVLCGTLIVLVLASLQARSQDLPVPPGNPSARPVHHGPRHEHSGHQHSDHRHHHFGGRSGPWFEVCFPGSFGGGYTSAFPAYFPSFSYFSYSVVVPPVTIVNPVAVNAAANPQPANNDPPAQGALDPKPKTTGAEQKARAGRFIGFGDANFGKQKYLAALERYKTAGKSAPDVAESYMRQGFALFAMGQYANAAGAFRRGLRIRSDWTGSPFHLDQIYDGARLSKTAHIESLAKAVEANPLDAELLLVLGMASFFDGQRDRAAVFLARSAQLGGNEDHLLDDFLPKAKPGDPPLQGGRSCS